ncbi:MAG: peptidylprolyl isomerase [Chloroflexi bacterium]|nr:MAG: peptidylprolyl isomerase [Chloroflexota bacterium]TMC33460.1 MAG: peptidylprolyl isomerase [Chloroflexota bacterium]TMC56708.1 MAG: peptidylprolyl isomerase [Chloroflexota bacterium]TME39581.1 MAG: peptidylprolyl isomerase [Chloroflexota bacterium]
MDRRTFLQQTIAALIAAACGSTTTSGASGGTTTKNPTPSPAPSKATVELAKGGSFTIALRPDKAPQTVGRFADKARSGFYNNLAFHRVEDWVVQGGDPQGTGRGGEQVPSEYNDLSFKLGAAGIARGQDPAINNGSQWFVVKKDSTFLDKQYTNFGQVTSGMDLVQKIAVGDKIKTITIE